MKGGSSVKMIDNGQPRSESQNNAHAILRRILRDLNHFGVI